MGKLIRYTHNLSKHEILCLVTYTLQGKITRMEVTVSEADLVSLNTHWGIPTLCQLLSSTMNFTVTA